MSSKKNLWIWVIVLLVVVGLIIYFVSFGQVNIIYDAEHANRQRRKEIEEELSVLEPEMEKDVALKKKLDRYVLWGFIGAKIVVIFFLAMLCVGIKLLFRLSWNELYEWKDKAGWCLATCLFLISGVEVQYFKSYPWMKALVKKWVYRKYGHLEQKILDRAAKIKDLKEELSKIPEPAKPGQSDSDKSSDS